MKVNHIIFNQQAIVCLMVIHLLLTGAVIEKTNAATRTLKDKLRFRASDRGQNNSVLSDATRAAASWPECNHYLFTNNRPCGHAVTPDGKYALYKWLYSIERCVYYSKPTTKLAWESAKSHCESIKARLARLDSDNINKVVYIENPNSNNIYWIGLTDQGSEGRFYWSDNNKVQSKLNFMPGNPNNKDGNQHCCTHWYNGGGKWDDDFCSAERPFICDTESLDNYAVATITLPTLNVMGTTVEFRCSMKSVWPDWHIRFRNAKGDMLYVGLDSTNYKLDISGSSKFLKFDPIPNQKCDYIKETDQPRCLIGCLYYFKVQLEPNMETVRMECCAHNDCTPKELKIDFQYTYTLPTFVQLLPAFKESLVMQFTKGYDYEVTCIARLGQYVNSTATVGVIPPKLRPLDAKFTPGALSNWSATYNASNGLVDETGVRPVGLLITSVSSAYADYWGGHHRNITISLSPALGHLYKAKFFCTSDVSDDMITYGGTRRESDPISISYTPQQPHMEVLWASSEGEIFAGHEIRARCTANVGTVLDHMGLIWNIDPSDNPSQEEWRVTYGKAPSASQDGVTLRQIPELRTCGSQESTWLPTGTCYFYITDAKKTWKEASTYCRDVLGYELASHIEDIELYMFLKDNTENNVFWIGLNDREMEGYYAWPNGLEAHDILEWGEWKNGNMDDNDTLNCVSFSSLGIETLDCESRQAFICQSRRNYITSRLTYDIDHGFNLTSEITLPVRKYYEDKMLQCSYWQRNNWLYAIMNEKQINLVPITSAPFQFVYGQLIPRITFKESLTGRYLSIQLNCSAVVGPEGIMTVTLLQRQGGFRRWIIGHSEEAIVVKNPSPDVDLYISEDLSNEDVGRRLQATMLIHLTTTWHRSVMTCYSYDTTDRDAEIVSYVTKSELRNSHYIDLANLHTIARKDVEAALNVSLAESAAQTLEATLITRSWILWIFIMMLIMAFITKDTLGKLAKKDGEEDEKEPTVSFVKQLDNFGVDNSGGARQAEEAPQEAPQDAPQEIINDMDSFAQSENAV